MKSLVVSLFKQVMDPSIISSHNSETFEVSSHSPNHTRHSSHSLKQKASLYPFLWCHILNLVCSHIIVAFSDHFDQLICNFVTKLFGLNVLHFYLINWSFWVYVMGHSVVGIMIYSLPSGKEIIQCFYFVDHFWH